MTKLSLPFALALALFAAGCEEELGDPTGSTCPTDSTLTYDNFGSEFMTHYCTGCHSETPPSGDRHGAPHDVNFDTLQQIQDDAEDIDRAAASGPDGTNTFMPDKDAPHELSGFSMPTMEERQQLGEWLACGAP